MKKRSPFALLPASRAGLLLLSLLALCWALKPQAQPAQAQQTQAQLNTAPEGQVQVQKDIVYGEAGGQKLLLDIYAPAAQGQKRPVMLLVHGGAWVAGDKQGSAFIGEFLARHGYVALGIDYRLATDTANKFPAQLDDAQRAVRWTRAHAAEYGIDPARLGALGDSAGGHLVSLLGMMDTRDNSDAALSAYSSRVACVVDLYGPADLTQPMTEPAQGMVAKFLGKTPQEAPDLYRAASPRFHIDKKTAPFLIFHGTADPLVPPAQSETLRRALQDAGIEATLIEFEGQGHGFRKKESLEKLAAATLDFLQKHLGPAQP